MLREQETKRANGQLERGRGSASATARATRLDAVLMVGNHLPRQCGIATFTTDLINAVQNEFSDLDCAVLAMNDGGRRHRYPARVRLEIAANELESYERAADSINAGGIDVVSLQHEYGIFGGEAGSHLLALVRRLRMPVVATLHTILATPNAAQRLVMDELTRLCTRLVVMSSRGAGLLREVHGVPEEKIDLIPHGIPSLPPAERCRKQLGVEGKSVILTFGLLSPDKGIEHVIDALPAILAHHPGALYYVVGVTHPHVKESRGEQYRLMLQTRALALGVQESVLFHDRFVSQDELTEFLAAADVYVTPYLQPEQSTSGTLAYALGSGKAVVSTPYVYAQELLANGRGVLVPWPANDEHGIARAIVDLLGDRAARTAMCERAAEYGKRMQWPAVARAYVRSFERAQAVRRPETLTKLWLDARHDPPAALPALDLSHLRRMTDCTGMLQHAQIDVPRFEDGYCLDDNARALLLASLLDAGPESNALAKRYLAFVRFAFNPRNGRFRNFLSYSRQWVDDPGSEDCQGRALWALGTMIARSRDPAARLLAVPLFRAGLRCVYEFTSPRAWAYTLLGIDEYLRAHDEAPMRAARDRLAQRLLELYQRTSSPHWRWFEDTAAYCNARLSQALLLSGQRMANDEMIAAGLQSLEWLCEVQRAPGDGSFAPIGSNGFYPRGGTMAVFDQQPVEAGAMVSACLVAERATEQRRWRVEAHRTFEWFLGKNVLRQSLYDPTTGGCRDGLHADRRNENQGAESTLAFLIALAEMRAATQPMGPRGSA